MCFFVDLSSLEKTAEIVCCLAFDPLLLTYQYEDKSAVLREIPRILNHILLLFTSANRQFPDHLYEAVSEIAYLPWVDSIDPPWFDWRPAVHNEDELKGLQFHLTSAIGKEFKSIAIQLILKLPCTAHVSWKIHVFRMAIVSEKFSSFTYLDFYHSLLII